MNERILVVDDEADIRRLIRVYLENEHYIVEEAVQGEEALHKIKEQSYDLVILDNMMPVLDGVATCLKIRETHVMPIIFLSAKGEDIHKIEGLAVGADDYMIKPFQAMELIARVKAQLRRYTRFNRRDDQQNMIEMDELKIDTLTHEVTVSGEEIKLTPKEYGILLHLAAHRGQVFSLEQLYEAVWEERYSVADTSIVVHITNLRRKIEADPKKPRYIKTVWGVGYKI